MKPYQPCHNNEQVGNPETAKLPEDQVAKLLTNPSPVLVSGKPCSGKTRLMAYVAKLAREKDIINKTEIPAC
jgi:predicted PilT family ATPase